ncbi:MAG: malonyl-ACP O-methyltransferase BioC [Gammaproteobacteria bacterium]|nr:malonyl-ACP O-methyltransferase BioC [Gammaproteobacteria bacterium]MBU1553369.1 malonyl-ACP O-methyltransferase BioC [Gammaproteobacteria bacterium]MBU2068862.1 malonyl-ACP O-methyltransferase BioC [Gammaproteobacteria bacterium]MBU2184975.1 malonyl-ACP O-methyltransferase BioC [Gammaproteobacteria bacterium]MBU2205653.1 malonyl-ACP O-methyltransferase BioC [Gammaproteobacteria bacterium]
MSAVIHPRLESNSGFKQQVANSFSAACQSYMQGARLQQQVALDALAMLPKAQNGHLLDLGCGPGWLHPRFADHCSSFTAVDLSAGMLKKAAQAALAQSYLQADAQQLPLADSSVDTVFSSLMLQWCTEPAAVFAEIARVLSPGGKVVITTLVDGTLTELAQAFASLDSYPHVSRFFPVDAIKQAALTANAMHWQFELRRYPLYYPDVQSLARELKLLGANQVAGRRNGLTGKGYWLQLAQAYETRRTMLGLPASYQVLIISGVKHGS